MRTINLTIEKQTLTLDSLESLPVQGSDNSVKLAFAFDDSWESYPTRRAYFQYHFSNWKYVELSNENEVLVPREFLAKPGFKVMIRGYAQSGAIMATNIENVPVEFAPSLADSTAVVPVAIRSGDDAISVEQEGDVVTISLNDEFESNKFISDYTIRGTASGEIIFLDGVLLGTTEKSFADFKSIYNQIVIPYEFTIGATTYHDTLVATETRYNAQNAYYIADLLPLGQNYTAIVTIYLDGTSVKAVIACLPFTLNNSFDNAPTSGSTKLVNSGVVYSALENVKTLLRAYSDANLATAKSYADDLLVEGKQYTDNKYNSLVGIITHETEVMEARITQAITQMQNQVNASITGMETTIQGELTALDQRVDEAISTMNTTISSSLTNMENTIQQELANLDTRFSTLQTALEARITTLSNQIDSQFSTLQTQLEGRIDTLEGEVDDKLAEADEAIAILNGYNERLTKVEGTYVTKLELYEALKRGEISSEVEKVYTSEINYIAENVMPSGKVTKILGKTEKSENLIETLDFAEQTINGVRYKIEGGWLVLNGSNNLGERFSFYIPNVIKSKVATMDTSKYSLKWFAQNLVRNSCYIGLNEYHTNYIDVNGGTLVNDGREIGSRIGVRIEVGASFNNMRVAPMLIQGSSAPTKWSQGYDGLKHTHITGLESTGINLWDEEWEVGSISYDNGDNVQVSNRIRSKNYIEVIPNATFYQNYNATGRQIQVFYYDQNHNFLGYENSFTQALQGLFTTPSNCRYIRFIVATDYGTTYNHDICINKSDSTINGNHYPYEEDTLEIEADLNEYDYIDVEEGKKVNGSLEIDLGANFSVYKLENSGTGAILWQLTPLSSLTLTSRKGVFEKYDVDTTTPNAWNIADKSLVFSISDQHIFLKDSSFDQMTSTEVKTALTGIKGFIERATPIVTDVEIPKDGWIDNLIQGGSLTQQVDTTDSTALIAKEVDIAVNVVVENQ